MDHNLLFIIFLFFALLILSIGIVAVLFLRKKILIIYQNTAFENIKSNVIEKLKSKNYRLKITDKKIHVEVGHFKALNLFIKQEENELKVFWEISQSSTGMLLTIIGIFLFGFPALILSQLIDIKSKELSREILPLLKDIK